MRDGDPPDRPTLTIHQTHRMIGLRPVDPGREDGSYTGGRELSLSDLRGKIVLLDFCIS